jgi:hypothetical protein
MLPGITKIHADRTGNATGLVDDVDVDIQEFGHFSADNPVAGIGTAAGTPDDHVGDISFGEILSKSTGGKGQKNNQTKNNNLFHFQTLLEYYG